MPSDAELGPGSVAAGTAAIRASLEQSQSMGIHDLRNEGRIHREFAVPVSLAQQK